jgi:hypothetical protein
MSPIRPITAARKINFLETPTMSALDPLPPTDALQQQPPEPPLAKLHIPDGIPIAPNVALPPNATVWTKLHLLLHAHQLAAHAARKILLLRLLLLAFALFMAIPAGALVGAGIFWLIYDDPSRNTYSYNNWPNATTYYIRGKQVSQQEYDYYLRSNGNEGLSLALAIPFGFITSVVTIGIIWLLLRPRKPTVLTSIEEQIAAIAKDHPDAVASWGGVAVLRVPQLIERLLDIQGKDAQR